MVRVNSCRSKKVAGFTPFRQVLWNIPSCDEYHLVVLIESTFRPLSFRIVEYLWLFLLLSVNSPRASTLTIGRNQLRYDHWLEYLQSSNKDLCLTSVLRSCERIWDARAATKWFLDWRGFYKDPSQSVSRLYTGRVNEYYDGLFLESRKLLRPGDSIEPLLSPKFPLKKAPSNVFFLRSLIWLSSLPFLIAAWICHVCNVFKVKSDFQLCRATLAKYGCLKISDELYDVLRLAEDHRNALHFGVDPVAICRAIWRNLTRGTHEGASTIEQQFVRSCIGRYERTLKRKFKEQMLAINVSRITSKRAISTAFILTAHYGDFHKGPLNILSSLNRVPEDATHSESAQLVARIKYPEPALLGEEWTKNFETRVRFLLRLSMPESGGLSGEKRRPFQSSFLSSYR